MQNKETELSKSYRGGLEAQNLDPWHKMKIYLQFVLQFLLKCDKYLMK